MRTLIAAAVTSFALVGFAPMASAQDVKANAEAGAKKAAMCMGCHSIPGYQASFPEVHKVPMIAGQSAAYLQSALAQYKTGDRKHPTMKAIATPCWRLSAKTANALRTSC